MALLLITAHGFIFKPHLTKATYTITGNTLAQSVTAQQFNPHFEILFLCWDTDKCFFWTGLQAQVEHIAKKSGNSIAFLLKKKNALAYKLNNVKVDIYFIARISSSLTSL